MRGNGVFNSFRQPERIDISPEINDVFFVQMIIFADFLYVASVKNRSCVHGHILLSNTLLIENDTMTARKRSISAAAQCPVCMIVFWYCLGDSP